MNTFFIFVVPIDSCLQVFASILSSASFVATHALYPPWHACIQFLQVINGDLSRSLEFFPKAHPSSSKTRCTRPTPAYVSPNVPDRVEVRRISWPFHYCDSSIFNEIFDTSSGVHTCIVVLEDEHVQINVISITRLEDIVIESVDVGFCVNLPGVPACVFDAEIDYTSPNHDFASSSSLLCLFDLVLLNELVFGSFVIKLPAE